MGKSTLTIVSNKTKDQKYKVHCTQCKRATNHVVMLSVDCDDFDVVGHQDDGAPITIDWRDNYQVIQCQGCDAISFQHIHWFSEDQYMISPHEVSNGTTNWLYPKRSAQTLAIKDYFNAPATLRRIYRETVECYNSDIFMLCAVGLRAIIEGICADQKILDGPVQVTKPDGSTEMKRKNNLEGKISGLAEKGRLTQPNAAILHEHRYLGNEAVHELSHPSQVELILAIEIVEHVLDALYELPGKANELSEKRARRLQTPGT